MCSMFVTTTTVQCRTFSRRYQLEYQLATSSTGLISCQETMEGTVNKMAALSESRDLLCFYE